MLSLLAKGMICIAAALLCYAFGKALLFAFWPIKSKRRHQFYRPAPIDIKELKPAEEYEEYSTTPGSVDGDSALKDYLHKTTE